MMGHATPHILAFGLLSLGLVVACHADSPDPMSPPDYRAQRTTDLTTLAAQFKRIETAASTAARSETAALPTLAQAIRDANQTAHDIAALPPPSCLHDAHRRLTQAMATIQAGLQLLALAVPLYRTRDPGLFTVVRQANAYFTTGSTQITAALTHADQVWCPGDQHDSTRPRSHHPKATGAACLHIRRSAMEGTTAPHPTHHHKGGFRLRYGGRLNSNPNSRAHRLL
jgi:hypothetical protein